MEKTIRLTENELTKIVKTLLKEEISDSVADAMWNAHPGSIQPNEFFPLIIPKQFESTGSGTGRWWNNTCATKMSMALAKVGNKVPGQYRTEIEYNGIPAKTTFNPSSKAMVKILTSLYGPPTLKLKLKSQSPAPEEILGRKGFYVLLTPEFGSSAAGHTDVWNGYESKNGDHWGVSGTLYFWGGEKKIDQWDRPYGDRWYGYDPKSKKWTKGVPQWYKDYQQYNKDQWGRPLGDKWYGYNPKTKKWTKGVPQWFKKKYQNKKIK